MPPGRAEGAAAQFAYRPSPTGTRLHNSDAEIRGIVGPFGSGKTTAVIMELLYMAMDQPAAPDGTRYSRFGIVRRSYPNLINITRRMLMHVLPRGAGYITKGNAPLRGLFRFGLPDGTMAHMELDLWALDGERAMENIRSANWTAVLFNEATEISSEVFDLILGRVGRYPDKDMGGIKLGGILMDFNPPPHDHWLWAQFAKATIEFDGHVFRQELFSQPPAAFKILDDAAGTARYEINPAAENLENLKGGTGFYALQVGSRLQRGTRKDLEAIDGLFCMLKVKETRGRLVWPNFSRERHVAARAIEPVRGLPAVVGFDTSGVHPAATVWQFQHGRWCLIDEMYGCEMGLKMFITMLLVPFFPAHYPGCHVVVSCDPADARDGWTAESPTAHLAAAGFEVAPKVSNRPKARVECFESMLNQDYGGVMVSPRCALSIKAIESDYHYPRRRIQGTVDYVYADAPAKNEASHLADSIGYFALHVSRMASRPDADAEALRRLAARRNGLRRRALLMGTAHV